MRDLGAMAAVIGIGQTDFSKDSGRSEMHLAAEASLAAIRDAGLTPADIDGTVTFTMDKNDEQHLGRVIGIPNLRFLARAQPPGGMAMNSVLQIASAAVISGAARNVLVYRAFNERSADRFGQPTQHAVRPTQNFRLPFALDTPAKIYGLDFQRYMMDCGLTNEDFGHYSVVARKHAANNPNAWFYERPITLDDHQNSRWIVEPVLRLLDCCQESDGGCAFVVTRADRVPQDGPPGVLIRAIHDEFSTDVVDIMPNYLRQLDRSRDGARGVWKEIGLRPSDIDVAMIYENFSPMVFMRLEDFGFCEVGGAKEFIASGQIELGGQLPVNTHGGLLGEAYIHGFNNILEAVRQARGTAVNQVPDAELIGNVGHGIVVFERMS